MSVEPTVFVIDDDSNARESVCALVSSMGLQAEAFESAEQFLNDVARTRLGCVITDLRMHGMSGLELQKKLVAEGCQLPLILVSAFVNVPSTVKAMESGAVTVLRKPCGDQELWDAIQRALQLDADRRVDRAHVQQLRERFGLLTDAERQVLDLISSGVPNKNAATQLSISLRTVEARRQRVMEKLSADSFAQLMEVFFEARQLGILVPLDDPDSDA